MSKTNTKSAHPNPGAAYVLDEIKELLQQRGEKYGPAREHFFRTCALLEVIFSEEHLARMRDRASEGALPITPFDWALIMICDKLARLSNPRQIGSDGHGDTLDDIIGYAALARDLYAEDHEA